MPKARFLSIEVLLNVVGCSQRVNRIVHDIRACTQQRLLFLAFFEVVLPQMLSQARSEISCTACGEEEPAVTRHICAKRKRRSGEEREPCAWEYAAISLAEAPKLDALRE